MKLRIEIDIEPGESITIARANQPNASKYAVSVHRHAVGLCGFAEHEAFSHQDPSQVVTELGRQAKGQADG